jgi:phosphate transport system ATP-binding protein
MFSLGMRYSGLTRWVIYMEDTITSRNITTKTPSPPPSSAFETSIVSEETARTIVDVDRVDFQYRASKALKGISLQIPEKKVTAFIGPSGCGKSTLLRCINRMNDLIDHAKITASEIRIDGVDINASDVDVIELRRRVGMVFQKSNPFPKSIYDNIAFGLRIAGIRDRRTIDETVEASLTGAALWSEVAFPEVNSSVYVSRAPSQRNLRSY